MWGSERGPNIRRDRSCARRIGIISVPYDGKQYMNQKNSICLSRSSAQQLTNGTKKRENHQSQIDSIPWLDSDSYLPPILYIRERSSNRWLIPAVQRRTDSLTSRSQACSIRTPAKNGRTIKCLKNYFSCVNKTSPTWIWDLWRSVKKRSSKIEQPK